MTKKLVMWAILAVVLGASVVSIVPLVLAHDDWHTKAVTIHAQGERDLIVTKIEESNGHVDWLFEWTVHCDNMSDMASINMTMKVLEEKKTSKLEIQKFVFHGDELSFGGWKGKGYYNATGYYYEIHGIGFGSYDSTSHDWNTGLIGEVSIVDSPNAATPWIVINMQAMMKYETE